MDDDTIIRLNAEDASALLDRVEAADARAMMQCPEEQAVRLAERRKRSRQAQARIHAAPPQRLAVGQA